MSAQALDLAALATRNDDGSFRLEAAIEGMTCAACIGEIETALRNVPGLLGARVNYANRRLSLEWREAIASDETPERASSGFDLAGVFGRLRRMGYRLHPFELATGERLEQEASKRLLRCLGIAAFAAMNIMLLSVAVWVGEGGDIDPATRDLFHGISALIALPAAAFAGQPFFESAFKALRAGRLNMDAPISLGVVLALSMSVYETLTHAERAYFDSAIMLLAFLLLGRYLDAAMRRRTRAVAGNLAALRAPLACRVLEDGGEQMVPAAQLLPGDHVLVRPGEILPADGAVIAGASSLDEGVITGETARRSVKCGDRVYAGSMNFDGALTLGVAAAGSNTLLDEIERLLEKATTAKSRFVRLADRVSKFYAPVVHLAALTTALLWLWAGASLHEALVTAVSVLIVTCPCALALAVPAVQVVASGHLFRNGVLLNAADAIERLAQVDTIVFDKTGTLTAPHPSVVNLDDIAPEIVALAAGLARASRHPLARALAAARPTAPAIAEASEEHGQGVRATIDGCEARLGSPAYCGLETLVDARPAPTPDISIVGFRCGERSAIFELRQRPRRDARETVEALMRHGLTVEILSGDRPAAVEKIARELNVKEWRGGVKPAEKVAHLEALRDSGRKVLMVGDGLNDAPALATAYASLSPIEATHITQAAADAVFLGERLAPVRLTIETSRKAQRIMRENLGLSIVYNLFATPLAMFGLLTPLIAAAAMSGSSLLVTLNALRAGGAAPQGPSSVTRAEELPS